MHSFGKSLCQLKKPSNLRRTGHRKLGTGIGNHRSQPSAIVLVGNSDGSTVEGSSLYKPDDYPVLSSGRPLRVESSVALPVPHMHRDPAQQTAHRQAVFGYRIQRWDPFAPKSHNEAKVSHDRHPENLVSACRTTCFGRPASPKNHFFVDGCLFLFKLEVHTRPAQTLLRSCSFRSL